MLLTKTFLIMKTQKELYADILKITMQIKTQFPELSLYIVEIPNTISSIKKPAGNRKVLQEYHDSMSTLLKDYIEYENKTSNLF